MPDLVDIVAKWVVTVFWLMVATIVVSVPLAIWKVLDWVW